MAKSGEHNRETISIPTLAKRPSARNCDALTKGVSSWTHMVDSGYEFLELHFVAFKEDL